MPEDEDILDTLPEDPTLEESFEAPTEAEIKDEEPKESPKEKPEETPKPEELRQKVLEEIAKRYSFDPTGAESLRKSPESVLPNYAARLYVDMFDSVMQAVVAQLPQMFRQQIAAQRAEEEFYREFPELADAKYRKSIINAAQVVRNSGEKLTPEQARERIGRMALAMHGIQKRSSSPVRPPAPIGAGTRGGSPKPKEEDIWASLISED